MGLKFLARGPRIIASVHDHGGELAVRARKDDTQGSHAFFFRNFADRATQRVPKVGTQVCSSLQDRLRTKQPPVQGRRHHS